MANVQYHLAPKAQAELDEKKRMLISSCKAGLISKDQVAIEFNELAARLYAVARIEVNGEEMVTTWCPDCRREHRMKMDVHEYRCQCSPHEYRVVAEGKDKDGLLTHNLVREANRNAEALEAEQLTKSGVY